MSSEAQARIKIDRLLTEKGWRLVDSEDGKANVTLESRTSQRKYTIDELGNDYEKTTNGFIDYLLLDNDGKAVAVVEAKRESINPLDAKEQAREYAISEGIRFIFLSNGNVHKFWDLEQGNPTTISHFLSLEELGVANEWRPDPSSLINLAVDENFIAVSQDPNWLNYTPEQQEREKTNQDIRVLRPYQLEAVHKAQEAYRDGKRAFLFEMATGTGKTLVSAAMIKLFIRSENAKRILFLVDRLELEQQTNRDFVDYLSKDGIRTSIYKKSRENREWMKSDVVITTIQTLTRHNHYRDAFAPSDFQLVITDEAHRTIGGNARSVFDYFTGVKLGLTATPRDYLKGVDIEKLQSKNPKALEKRLLLDTYEIFGCADGKATFVYSLQQAVNNKPPYLCNPKVIDARTDITAQILSEKGFAVTFTDEEGNEKQATYTRRDFHKKFCSRPTNVRFVKAFLKHAKRDPITGEIGKTIVFAVNRRHAGELTEILNNEIDLLYPNKYQSDFAVQITSELPKAQQNTQLFAKNQLNGRTQFKPELIDYKSSKTRVCVTVGMMTTGYNCRDLLNVVLARPIFSPSLFIQIKGRGTRLYTFDYKYSEPPLEAEKDNFFLFDFFANCEYFEEKFDYDAEISLPPESGGSGGGGGEGKGDYYYTGIDKISILQEQQIGLEGMKIDREMFKDVERDLSLLVKTQPDIAEMAANEQWESVEAFVMKNLFNDDISEVDKFLLNYIKENKIDREIGLAELLMKMMGRIEAIKNRQSLSDEYFEQYLASSDAIDAGKYMDLKRLFQAYLMYEDVRTKIDSREYNALTSPINFEDLKLIGKEQMDLAVKYIKDYVPIDKFRTIN